MPTYSVVLREIAEYTIKVTAKNEDAAAVAAEKYFLGSIICDFPTEVLKRDVTEIERIRRKRKTKLPRR